jgi:hypothetical protein
MYIACGQRKGAEAERQEMNTILKRFSILFIISLLFVASVFAAPFGIEMGMTLEQLKQMGVNPVLLSDGSGRYYITPIKQHPDFERYIVNISPTYGVYRLLAVSKGIPTSSFGTDLKNKFYEIQKGLSSVYGESKTFDFLKVGSIWNQDRDWMMALKNEERYLDAFWDRESNSNLPDNLHGVWLRAQANSSSEGYFRLQYESINAKGADAERAAQTSSVF